MDYVMFIVKSDVEPDFNMHYVHNFIEARGMAKEGEIIEFADNHAVWDYVRNSGRENGEDWSEYRTQYWTSKHEWIQTNVMVKPELVEMYKSLCKRGRSKFRIMELMSDVIRTKGDQL